MMRCTSILSRLKVYEMQRSEAPFIQCKRRSVIKKPGNFSIVETVAFDERARLKASRGEFNVTDSREGIRMKAMFLKGTLFSVLLFVSLLSISCGGGGGDSPPPPPPSDTTAPSVPGSLIANVISAGQIDLSWNVSTDNTGVTGYKIYRNTAYLTTVTSNSRSDMGLFKNTNYCYRVSAVDAAGNESGQSPQACATTLDSWTKQWGTTTADYATGVAVDGSGTYVTGYTNGNLDGNTNAGGYDAFLTKYDSSGVWQWTKLLGQQGGGANAAGNDWATGVAVDGSGNIYVTGYTLGNLDGNINAGGYDAFLTMYNSSGILQWTKLLGTTGDDWASSVAVDGSGIYVTGGTTGGLHGEPNAGGYDSFLAKYDSTGGRQWTKLLGSAEDESAYGVAADGSGYIYVTGYTLGDLYGTNAGLHDAFLAQYDSTGDRKWTRQLGTAGDDWANGVAVDGSGYIYVTGPTIGNLEGNINAGSGDAFLAQYDSTGALKWTKLLGTAAPDDARAVAMDGSGNIYITGGTDGNLDGNNNAGSTDVFLTQYDSSGTRNWTKLLGTAGGESAYGVAAGGGYIYVTGPTTGNLDGNINEGGIDIYLGRYSAAGVKQ